jgi:HSP20 family protein
MTLVKWNRNGKSNGNGQSQLSRGNTPAGYPAYGSVWPGLFDTFSRPFFGNDLMQDFFDDTMNLGTGSIGTTLPAVNISETDTDLVIEVAAPGMSKKDFKVEIVDNQLHIAYNKQVKQENNGENNHWRREFSFESFERSFSLPAIVESDKVAASYTDGILRISITKKEEARRKPARAVEIK